MSEKANFGGALRSRLYSKSFHTDRNEQQNVFKSKRNRKFVAFPKPRRADPLENPPIKRKRPDEAEIEFVTKISQSSGRVDSGELSRFDNVPSMVDFRTGQNNPFLKPSLLDMLDGDDDDIPRGGVYDEPEIQNLFQAKDLDIRSPFTFIRE